MRTAEACRGRHLLVVVEGGEEADGKDNRTTINELLSVLSPENRWLLLTRVSTQANPAESVEVKSALNHGEAGALLDYLTKGRLAGPVRERTLKLLEGHPLALTWAGNLLARDDEDPQRLIDDWAAEQLPDLRDPKLADHTLAWLFDRSVVRTLDETRRQVLSAAAQIAHAPFPLEAMKAAVPLPSGTQDKELRECCDRSLRRACFGVQKWIIGSSRTCWRIASHERNSASTMRFGNGCRFGFGLRLSGR